MHDRSVYDNDLMSKTKLRSLVNKAEVSYYLQCQSLIPVLRKSTSH